ncbi:KxYKxGKxW signal peptide domain-containing protein, partial [Leuconostoc citreum]
MNEKLRYKMYKSGKHWIFAGLMSFFVVTGPSYLTQKVSADEVPIEKANTNKTVNPESHEITAQGIDVLKSTEKKLSSSITSTMPLVPSNDDTKTIQNNIKKDSDIQDNSTSNKKTISANDKDYTHTKINSGEGSDKLQQQKFEKDNNEILEKEGQVNTDTPEQFNNNHESVQGNQNDATDLIQVEKDSDSYGTSIDIGKSKQYTINTAENVNSTELDSASSDNKSTMATFRSKNVDVQFSDNKIQTSTYSKSSSQSFSVTDPIYPNNMWKNPSKDQFTFNYLLKKDQSQQLIFSTDRNGATGTVYVYLIDSQSQKVIEQSTINKNSQITLQNNGVTIFNDNFNGVVWSNGQTWSREYSVNGSLPGRQFGKISYFVPILITQTVKFVDENGNNIIDSNGQTINPIVQQGLTGQEYTTSAPKLVKGFYSGHYQITPENSAGKMSQFGVPGAQYTRDFHDGYKIIFTEIDGNGLMNAKVIDPTGQVIYENNNLGKGQTDSYVDKNVNLAISNPYVTQTRNVVYVYKLLGSLVPDVPGSTPVPYPNDPS